MFAVPGWNVSAPLATQIEKSKPKDPPEGKKSKKRKRKQQEQDVDDANVGEYWDRIIEGKDTKNSKKADLAKSSAEGSSNGTSEKKKDKKDKKRKNKSEKVDTEENGSTPQLEGGAVPGTQAEDSSNRDKKKRKKEHKSKSDATSNPPQVVEPIQAFPEPVGLTPLQKSMRAKLTSARFRHLNESLYTKPSAESLALFKSSPDMFEDYHRGFAQQVEVWPENPVDGYVSNILSRGKVRPKPSKFRRDNDRRKETISNDDEDNSVKPLPRNFKGQCTIADLGCGTASLAQRLQPSFKSLNLTFHSFDLSKPTGPAASLVTIADISALPLPDTSVDVAIFCLALMGTNWLDFIDEAWRILRWKGELWVSEIKSRFGRVSSRNKVPINSVGSLKKKETPKGKGKSKGNKPEAPEPEGGDLDSADEEELAHRVDGAETREGGTDVSAFVAALKRHGFVLDALPERQADAIDLQNKMFVKMHFVKAVGPTRGKNVKEAEPGTGGTGSNRVGMKPGMKKWKFADRGEDNEANDEADAKTLKPCLYKIR